MIRRIARSQLGEAPRTIGAAALQQALSTARGSLLPTPRRSSGSEAVQRALAALLSEELALRPEHVREVVERELVRQRRARTVTLHVHPEDLTLLDEVRDYLARLELGFSLQLLPDATLTRGGCVVRSNLGEVDARLETRLSAALELLATGGFDAP